MPRRDRLAVARVPEPGIVQPVGQRPDNRVA
jgi:hypothetical protein